MTGFFAFVQVFSLPLLCGSFALAGAALAALWRDEEPHTDWEDSRWDS